MITPTAQSNEFITIGIWIFIINGWYIPPTPINNFSKNVYNYQKGGRFHLFLAHEFYKEKQITQSLESQPDTYIHGGSFCRSCRTGAG